MYIYSCKAFYPPIIFIVFFFSSFLPSVYSTLLHFIPCQLGFPFLSLSIVQWGVFVGKVKCRIVNALTAITSLTCRFIFFFFQRFMNYLKYYQSDFIIVKNVKKRKFILIKFSYLKYLQIKIS